MRQKVEKWLSTSSARLAPFAKKIIPQIGSQIMLISKNTTLLAVQCYQNCDKSIRCRKLWWPTIFGFNTSTDEFERFWTVLKKVLEVYILISMGFALGFDPVLDQFLTTLEIFLKTQWFQIISQTCFWSIEWTKPVFSGQHRDLQSDDQLHRSLVDG